MLSTAKHVLLQRVLFNLYLNLSNFFFHMQTYCTIVQCWLQSIYYLIKAVLHLVFIVAVIE